MFVLCFVHRYFFFFWFALSLYVQSGFHLYTSFFSNCFVRAYHMRSQLDWFFFCFVCLFVVKLFLIDESSLCPQCLHKVLFFRHLHFVTNSCVFFVVVSFFSVSRLFSSLRTVVILFLFECCFWFCLFSFQWDAFNIFYLHVTFKFVCMFRHVPWRRACGCVFVCGGWN